VDGGENKRGARDVAVPILKGVGGGKEKEGGSSLGHHTAGAEGGGAWGVGGRAARGGRHRPEAGVSGRVMRPGAKQGWRGGGQVTSGHSSGQQHLNLIWKSN
jgi:hypothetical protein